MADKNDDWANNPDWWASVGHKGVTAEDPNNLWRSGLKHAKNLLGKVTPTTANIRGGGGGGGSSYNIPGHNGGVGSSGGPGVVLQPGQGGNQTYQAGPAQVDIDQMHRSGLDERARVEILKVKQTLQRLIGDHHIPDRAVIAGGVFVSLFHDEPIEDIDVFVVGCKGSDQCTLPDVGKTGKYKPLKNFESYTGRDDIIGIFNDTDSQFQYIYTKVETPRELLERFDFTHCCCAYYDDKLWINARIYDAIKNKWLIPNIEPDMIQARRREKFSARGFIDPGNLTNLYGKT